MKSHRGLYDDILGGNEDHEKSDDFLGLIVLFLVEEVPLAIVVSSRIEEPSGS